MANPKIVIILSGKRKSGKDHVANFLNDRIKRPKVYLRIADPIKKQYTANHNLDYEKSLTSSEYKESFRKDMVQWSEMIRKDDPNIFLRKSIDDNHADQYPIWILTDARRQSDIEFFVDSDQFKNCDIIKIRIEASDDVRMRRGFIFANGVDDAETECGLDHFKDWSLVAQNNDLSDDQLSQNLSYIINKCNDC